MPAVILVGGVSQLYQGDLDLGRLAVQRLADERLGAHVLVEDLHYGAVAVAQRLEELRPEALLLVGAEARGRPPGAVERRRTSGPDLDAQQVGEAVAEAVQGYVGIEVLLAVCRGLDALPGRTVTIEVEPADVDPGERLSPAGAAGLDVALALARAEVRRTPLLLLAERVRPLVTGDRLRPSEARDAVVAICEELRLLDEEGRWGRTFAERDRLRGAIADGRTSEGMDHLDWGLWWGLVEELDRLEALEAIS